MSLLGASSRFLNGVLLMVVSILLISVALWCHGHLRYRTRHRRSSFYAVSEGVALAVAVVTGIVSLTMLIPTIGIVFPALCFVGFLIWDSNH